MTAKIEGNLQAGKARFALAVSRFNEFITGRLLDGAVDSLLRHGSSRENITVVWVPGSFELPLVALKLAESRTYDAVVCLGCLIRGQTPHFDYIAAEAAKGIAQVGLRTGVPTIFGVITADTLEQAIERAGTKGGNKGADAARSAIEMVNLLGQLSGQA